VNITDRKLGVLDFWLSLIDVDMHAGCVSQLSVTMIKYSKNQLIKEKVHFDSVSEEVSDHSCFVLSLWASSGTVHHDRNVWQNSSVHLMVPRKQGAGKDANTSFKGMPI
jgi:hypothetical protein